ncbi:dihydrodipicolinate synthase family protein [Microbacterium sp. H1-D42]|uniref:dihydrodipicolinate synthase family protein n=1 Tax=Microbacterium sp. H1-D42 TaxID=2925844 RepID=UPI001F53D533|nr:dihydrodipicolinate synthase family protein [Microbacterium sp. H1-D42]UNK70335.1 dihydrodipicolinate synthase family protein [Microbacterium sp. H1-D42]
MTTPAPHSAIRVHSAVRVRGVCPVVETPFTADDEVDFDAFRSLARHLAATGVRSVMFPGFASEFYKLTDAERDQLTVILIDEMHAAGDVIVVASVPDHSTRVAVDRARRAVELGADMINILPPHAHGPSVAAVRAHVSAVLEAIAPVPAILQYAPAQTGTALDADIIARMAAENSNLVQVKVESAPPGRLISALREAAPQLSCVVGHAGVQFIDALRRGAVGVQPGCSFPELYLRVWSLWQEGESDAAARLHTRMIPYLSYWMQSVELIIAAEKEISRRRGLIPTAACRAPARALDAEELSMIDRFSEEFAAELSGAAPPTTPL